MLRSPTENIAPEVMLPAVRQGALGIEQRADDRALSELLAPLSHPDTKILVTAERSVILRSHKTQMPPAKSAGSSVSELL